MKIKKAEKPVLTIGMIVKNEIRCLERCLKSLEPLRNTLPCELIIADTGSDDGTREIAEKYADLVFDFEWIDDFAAARNAVLDKAQGEWFLTIDADEWLDEDFSELVGLLKEPKKEKFYQTGAVTQRNYSTAKLSEGPYGDFLALRLFKRLPGVQYKGAIHEAVDFPSRVECYGMRNVILHHDGYVKSIVDPKAKSDRNMALLREKLKENPRDVFILQQCFESSVDKEGQLEYIYKALEGVKEKWHNWQISGPIIFSYAVDLAYKHKLSELWNWVKEAEELFPNSIFIRSTVNYFALRAAQKETNWPEAIRRGEAYLRAMKDYWANQVDLAELMRATPSYLSAVYGRNVHTWLANAYYEENDYPAALKEIRAVDASLVDDSQINILFCTLLNLQIHSELDLTGAITDFWNQISAPKPSLKRAKERVSAIALRSASLFSWELQKKELEGHFLRPSYQIFYPLGENCELGIAAAMLDTIAPEELERLLAKVEDWQLFPIHALVYAIDSGATFPIPGKVLPMETLDFLAGKLAGVEEDWLVKYCLSLEDTKDLNWTRALLLAAVQTVDTEKSDSIMELVQRFADFERTFLPYCYAPAVLAEEGQPLLPPIHRFGSALADAFTALDAGDKVGYVRHIREGLVQCESMKPLAEYLCEQVKSWQKPSPELQALAEQIKTILAAYPEDDPAVVAIRQSEAYQKVAWLLESPSEQ